MLEIRLLGPLEVVRDGTPLTLLRSKKTRALLGYLVATARSHRRERLCALLWDVTDDPRGALRWSVSKIRALLDEPGCARVAADRQCVGFTHGGAHVDLHAVRARCDAGLANLELAELERALGEFRGEFMAELDCEDFHEYQSWLVAERSAARAQRLALLRELSARLANEPERALPHLRARVELERDDPAAWCALMAALSRSGALREAREQGELALRQFKDRPAEAECVRAALRELADAPAAGAVNQPPSAAPPAPVAAPVPQQIRFCRSADGVQLAYARVGSGPPLVKSGNWITHLEREWASPVWHHLLGELVSRHTLVRYDQRGNGMSDWEIPSLEFEHMVSDLEAVVDAAGLERFALLGISQGCAVSVAYAARHPERVTRMVLHGGYAQGWLSWGKEAVKDFSAMTPLMRSGWGRDNPAFRQMFTSLFIPDATVEQSRWFNELQRVSCTAEGAIRLGTALGPVDVRPLLSQVRAPTLVTHSRGDALTPFEWGRKLAGGIPGAMFLPLDSDNHVILEQEPAWDVFRRAIADFLAEDAG